MVEYDDLQVTLSALHASCQDAEDLPNGVTVFVIQNGFNLFCPFICHDNAVAESFFQLLKRERIKRKIYSTREDARSDVFDYIEMFYNAKRRHGFNNQLSPVEFEKRYAMSLQGV